MTKNLKPQHVHSPTCIYKYFYPHKEQRYTYLCTLHRNTCEQNEIVTPLQEMLNILIENVQFHGSLGRYKPTTMSYDSATTMITIGKILM